MTCDFLTQGLIMFRKLLLSILLSGFLFASSHYTVRLAVFKSAHDLQKTIDKFPPALKKTVMIEKRGELTYAYTLPTSDRKTLKKLLPSYRKFFSDAYIGSTKK
jgi:hypothetical protein